MVPTPSLHYKLVQGYHLSSVWEETHDAEERKREVFLKETPLSAKIIFRDLDRLGLIAAFVKKTLSSHCDWDKGFIICSGFVIQSMVFQ